MTADAILSKLAELAMLIESHRTAIYLLEQQQCQLREQLIPTGWTPPSVPERTPQ